MKKYTLCAIVGVFWINLGANGMMNNFATDFRVIATRQDLWRGSNLSAPGLMQEGQSYTREQAIVNGAVIPMLSSPLVPGRGNVSIGDLFLRHSESFDFAQDEESKKEILRLRLRMTINPETQFEQQVEAVRLFEHYI